VVFKKIEFLDRVKKPEFRQSFDRVTNHGAGGIKIELKKPGRIEKLSF
jgi:hypothetical protein